MNSSTIACAARGPRPNSLRSVAFMASGSTPSAFSYRTRLHTFSTNFWPWVATWLRVHPPSLSAMYLACL